MAKYEKRLRGNFDELLGWTQRYFNGSISVLQDKGPYLLMILKWL